MNQARKLKPDLLAPGDLAPESGVYEAVHGNCPSQELQMIFLAGQKLPLCAHCRSQVRFQLQRAIPHISQDRDFKG
jgi:hypothetical protein